MGKRLIQIDETVKQMNKLYISERKKHLEQTKDGYLTNKFYLADKHIEEHLKGKATYGVFAGEVTGGTKFMTFDVDIADNPNEAIKVTQKLFFLLTNHYGISENEIHISFSGSKGYHVDLFFDKMINRKLLVPFYNDVLKRMTEKTDRIELRPTGQGVKLPLGINQKTNKYCYFVNPYTFGEMFDSISYFNKIEQSDWTQFKETVLDKIEVVKEEAPSPVAEVKKEITTEQAQEFETLVSQLNLEGKSLDSINQEIVDVLQNGTLKYPNTRHRMSFLIPVFFNSQGADEETALNQAMKVLLNTFDKQRDFIDQKTKRTKVISEVERLVRITYKKGYTLTGGKKAVSISKNEILDVLSVKKWNQKKLYLSMLIHSKRYATVNGVFFMAYSTMANMGNDKNGARLLPLVLSLEKQNKIEVVSRGIIDKARSLATGSVINEANKYKVVSSIKEDTSPTIELKVGFEVALEEIIALLLSEDEAKKILPKSQYYNTGIREVFKKKVA